MKLSELSKILTEEAKNLKFAAGMNGEHGDGGSSYLLKRLNEFQNKLVIKHDLRPSEFHLLNELEVGSPVEFDDIIHDKEVEDFTKHISEIFNKVVPKHLRGEEQFLSETKDQIEKLKQNFKK